MSSMICCLLENSRLSEIDVWKRTLDLAIRNHINLFESVDKE